MARNREQAQKLHTRSEEVAKKILNSLPRENFSRLWAYLLVDSLSRHGITQFYLSPGMRNAPFLHAVDAHPQSNGLMGMDERAQAFRALGYAKATGKPSVLICTSGTAMAHYFPAIIEASKSHIPLIVISCDRPPELSFSNANQTIQQDQMYGQYVRHFHNLGAPTPEVSPRAVGSLVSQAISQAIGDRPGPVHINMPLREPVDLETDDHLWGESKKRYFSSVEQYIYQSYPQNYPIDVEKVFSELNLEDLKNRFASFTQPLLVIGELSTHQEKQSLLKMLKTCPWSKVIDVMSGVKFEFNLENRVCPTFDHPEVYEAYCKNPPDAIVHIGGRTTSKHYYRFLRENPEIPVYLFQADDELNDPAHRVNYRAIGKLNRLCEQLGDVFQSNPTPPEYIQWHNFVATKSKLIDQAPLAYPSLSKTLIENFPEDFTLYLGNSTVIRSFDSYASEDFSQSIPTQGHRGASGIEGFVASALGFCEGSEKPVCLVLGDVALYHDLNSLELLFQFPAPVLVIVANNLCGGIFSLLPVAKDANLKRRLTTPHQLNFENLAKAFQLNAKRVTDKEMWLTQLKEAQEFVRTQKKPFILEAMIDDDTNTEIYKTLRTVKL